MHYTINQNQFNERYPSSLIVNKLKFLFFFICPILFLRKILYDFWKNFMFNIRDKVCVFFHNFKNVMIVKNLELIDNLAESITSCFAVLLIRIRIKKNNFQLSIIFNLKLYIYVHILKLHSKCIIFYFLLYR